MLDCLLKYHGFKEIDSKGYSQIWSKTNPKNFLKIVLILDKLVSRYKTLAPNLLILSRK